MFAARAVTTVQAPLSRGISRSALRMGEHGHEHLVFEKGPFNARSIGTGLFLIVGGGIGATLGICAFQNWKGGFPQKKD